MPRLRWIAPVAIGLLALACGSNDYCSERQTAVNIFTSKMTACSGDGGFATGFTESSCADVLTGGNCSDGDRTALATIGNAGINCANANPVCSPATPFDSAVLTLQLFNCIADAGIPATSVSGTCAGALASVNASY